MAGRNKTGKQSRQSGDEEKSIINPINALIGSIGIIIVALIGYLATIRGATLPIEATQTAEALHTSIAVMTQAAFDPASPTSTALTPSSTLTIPSDTPTSTGTPQPPIVELLNFDIKMSGVCKL